MIKLSKSSIGEEERLSVLKVLDNEMLGMGENVKMFEDILSNFFNRKTICVVNGTCALQLAIQAVGIKEGDEVLVQSLTYVATFQAIVASGGIPISCDIDPNTLLIDLKDAEKKLSSKTKIIIPVHYAGDAGELDLIYDFAKKNSLRVIEDAAHAFGSISNQKLIGSFGDIACFSFDGIKNITSGEGGCIVTDDTEVLKKVSDYRLLSVKNDSINRYNGKRTWEFDVNEQGWRFHMSNIMAAIGIEQFKKFNLFAKKRQNISIKYDQLFFGNEKIKIFIHNYNYIVPHIYVIRIIGLKNRRKLQEDLLKLDIQTGVHYQPNHKLTFFNKYYNTTLPITENIFPELLTLPLHYDLTEYEVSYVVLSINNLLKDEVYFK